MIENVAIYLRKSRKEDGLTDAEALQNHRDVLTALCASKDWTYMIFEEVGSSASLERPALQKMLKSLISFDAVLVMDIDRLSRDRYDSALIMRHFKESDIKIVTADGRVTDLRDDTDSILTGMQEVFADYEYKQITKRLIRGRQASAKAGNWASGRAPLGYDYNRETKRLRINESEAVIVRRMFNAYAYDNMSLAEIAIELNQAGYRGKNGGLFNAYTVRRIMMNGTYLGHSTQHDITVTNTHETIVSETLFEDAAKTLKRNSKTSSRVKASKHSLSGLITCGYCGKIHWIQVAEYKTTTTRYIKGCFRRDVLTGESCSNKSANYEETLQTVLSEIDSRKEELSAKIQEALESQELVNNSREVELDSYKEELKKIQAQIDKLTRLVLADALSEEEFISLKKEKEARRQEIAIEVVALEKSNPYEIISEWQKMYDKLVQLSSNRDVLSEKGLNEILRSAILKVELFHFKDKDTEPRIKIHWR
ncbi:recombinase family protein [Bacillus wiedmannii]|uniref:recombinase family protein n=1 Tax=Bacillus wiedmannii TaxID=1890302 RepID=UPI0015CF77B4|nr:recombinase family protein [Bacillus wiedmannii]